jgi:predicted DNA-binding transcriptional regulator YafY
VKKTFDNILQLHHLLRGAHHPVSLKRIREALECSTPTAHRTIGYLRTRGATIEYRRNPPAGYIYTDETYELPTLWFSPEELQALFLVQQLLLSFQPGLLDKQVAPLRRKLVELLRAQGLNVDSSNRIRLLRAAARPVGPCFNEVATALMQRRRLKITYAARSTGHVSTRDVSPQRLVHYRDNWVLDAFCHLQKALRSFSVDCIEKSKILKTAAIEISDDVLDQHLASSYGIFAGTPTAIARLLFTPERARWVSSEQWHPQQKGTFLDSGEYLLEFPYGRSEELVLDILRYGPDVEVLEPLDLRQEVIRRLKAAVARYSN